MAVTWWSCWIFMASPSRPFRGHIGEDPVAQFWQLNRLLIFSGSSDDVYARGARQLFQGLAVFNSAKAGNRGTGIAGIQ